MATRIGADREANAERMARVEQGLEAARQAHRDAARQRGRDSWDSSKASLRRPRNPSARTAMAQTDSLVERVVEALESLQSAVLEPHEGAGRGSELTRSRALIYSG